MAKKKLIDVTSDQALEFNYQKSALYRTIHVDGAILGTTPRGLFALTLYNERGVIPRRTKRPVLSESGEVLTLGEEVSIESLDGIMRQVEITVMMDERTIKELRNVFQMIDEIDEDRSPEKLND